MSNMNTTKYREDMPEAECIEWFNTLVRQEQLVLAEYITSRCQLLRQHNNLTITMNMCVLTSVLNHALDTCNEVMLKTANPMSVIQAAMEVAEMRRKQS